ncbi:MAG TPA: DUF3617 family protein [Hyphomicrobiaceae bacterium]|nr:DUF3617 family protein [Hyphomicrobiaceae bacterium]
MRKLVSLLPAAAVLTAPLVLSAQPLDLPPRKAGLWEITMAVEKPGNVPAMTTKMCLDPATDRELMEYGLKFTDGKCKSVSRREGSALIINADCKIGGKPSKTTVVITGDFRSAYTARIEGTMASADGKKPQMTQMTQTATWKSADCPGMKPGDITMLGGVKVNIKQLKALSGLLR